MQWRLEFCLWFCHFCHWFLMLRYTSWKLTWNDQKRSWKLILGLNIYVFLGNLCSKLRHWHRYIMIRMISSFPFKVFLWWIPMPCSIIPLNLLEHFPQNGSKRDFIDLQQGKRIVFQWNTLNGNGFSLSFILGSCWDSALSCHSSSTCRVGWPGLTQLILSWNYECQVSNASVLYHWYSTDIWLKNTVI